MNIEFHEYKKYVINGTVIISRFKKNSVHVYMSFKLLSSSFLNLLFKCTFMAFTILYFPYHFLCLPFLLSSEFLEGTNYILF